MLNKMILELQRIQREGIDSIIDEDLLKFDEVETLGDCIDFIYDPRNVRIREVIR